jgi:chromosome segregation ATPase
MARQETTFETVAAAAADLQKKGRPVTVEAVSELLPGASANDVYRQLAAWRADNVAPPEAPKAELPQPLLDELAKWARQYADDAAAPARATLAQAESDLEALRAAGEALEAERDDLALARSEAEAGIAERDDTIERLNAELRDAKQVAMDALVSKAKDQLAIDGKENQLAALRAEVERHMAAQAAESDARLRAEMELVGATTARDNFAAEAKELRTQLDAARSERGKLRAELEALRGKR